jgi:hypothetical protein
LMRLCGLVGSKGSLMDIGLVQGVPPSVGNVLFFAHFAE